MVQHPSSGLHSLTGEHWKAILVSEALWPPLVKSLAVARWTVLGIIALAAPAAYVIARLPRPWKYALILGLFVNRTVPEVATALPVSVRFLQWGLLDTRLGLALAHLIKTLRFVAWILVGTFETIPVELEEPAQVDGCHRLGSLTRVVLPLAMPGVAVAALFAWLESWNEFPYALYLSVTEHTPPLQISYYVARRHWFDSATYATLLTGPVVV
jgi:trehalose transport system permease protein